MHLAYMLPASKLQPGAEALPRRCLVAEIRRYPFLYHLRAETHAHVVRARGGKVVAQWRGLAFWFRPLTHSVAEVPLDDRELTFLAHGRARDFQEVTVQGAVTWRIVDAARAAERVDFSLDLRTGRWRHRPVEQLEGLLTGLAEQVVQRAVASHPVAELMAASLAATQSHIAEAIMGLTVLAELGVRVEGVRVGDLRPSPEVERALQTPARERIQQSADEATFARRALAVDKERAIAENELANRIELAKREADLIEQRGRNAHREAEELAAARKVEAAGEAERVQLAAEAEASRIRQTLLAKAEGEAARLALYRDLPQSVIVALAAQSFAEKLNKIEHLNVSPELLGPLLGDLVRTGTGRLAAGR